MDVTLHVVRHYASMDASVLQLCVHSTSSCELSAVIAKPRSLFHGSHAKCYRQSATVYEQAAIAYLVVGFQERQPSLIQAADHILERLSKATLLPLLIFLYPLIAVSP